MPEKKGIKVVPIANGEVHQQNEITAYKCYICNKEETEDMLLLHIKDKQMGFVCEHHPGVIQEFMRQFKHLPLGWVQTIVKE